MALVGDAIPMEDRRDLPRGLPPSRTKASLAGFQPFLLSRSRGAATAAVGGGRGCPAGECVAVARSCIAVLVAGERFSSFSRAAALDPSSPC